MKDVSILYISFLFVVGSNTFLSASKERCKAHPSRGSKVIYITVYSLRYFTHCPRLNGTKRKGIRGMLPGIVITYTVS